MAQLSFSTRHCPLRKQPLRRASRADYLRRRPQRIRPAEEQNGGTGSGNGSTPKNCSRSGESVTGCSGGGKKKGDTGAGDESITGAGDIGASKVAKSREHATQQTLAAWLNFAKGAIEWTELVDTDGDNVPDTAFGDLIAEVKSILNNPDATKDDLNRAKDLAESVNQHDKNNPDCGVEVASGTSSYGNSADTPPADHEDDDHGGDGGP
ncbi:MAG: hypothetical protein QGF59_01910, partial [Pirellulaceae bacterium]|nr:hypothetical protein [Pirellulaceae bacterium]